MDSFTIPSVTKHSSDIGNATLIQMIKTKNLFYNGINLFTVVSSS